jgi:hypothetical protein
MASAANQPFIISESKTGVHQHQIVSAPMGALGGSNPQDMKIKISQRTSFIFLVLNALS